MRLPIALASFALVLLVSAVTSNADSHTANASRPLEVRTLQASVVRMGSLHGKALAGVRLRALVCSRSGAEANRTLPTATRISHYVTTGRTARTWGKPFRVVDNDLYWVVSLGESGRVCRYLTFEDVIPPENYGGVESALGVLGFSDRYHCYGVQLTLRAALESADQKTSTPISTTRRTIVQCGRFHSG